jgi:hypothetical protein
LDVNSAMTVSVTNSAFLPQKQGPETTQQLAIYWYSVIDHQRRVKK